MIIYSILKKVIKLIVPQAFWRFLRAWFRRFPVVYWGSLRSRTPVSRVFGLDRGKPIDRYYIETFLFHNSADIQGHILEIGDASYTRMFGGAKVVKSDVLHVTPDNAQATLVGNLATGEGIPSNSFDCLILTQTLPFIYDVQVAIANAYSALKPDGVLLATFPGISQISRYDMDRWGDYWRFTDASARRMFGEVFGAANVVVKTQGNVLVACAFLHGLAQSELKPAELDYRDPDYQVMITVRAVKSEKAD
jgi:SAM-dependent methyltransferase